MSSEIPGSVSIPVTTIVQKLVGGGILAVNGVTGAQYTFDAVAAAMWDALATTSTVEQAKTALLERYDVDEPTLTADLAEYLARLLEAGLVQKL